MGDRRALRAQWRRCRRIAATVSVPDPFDVGVFIGQLAAARGRPIELMPVRARHDTPCGLLVTTERADYIVYSADTPPLHRQHILLHEAAHIVCGHQQACPTTVSAAAVLLPHLDAGLVRRVLGRTVYTDPQEREAELVASLILARATRPDRPGLTTRDVARYGLRALFDPAGGPDAPTETGESR
ncbi:MULTISPECIES: ParH-like protein [unclassified Streptomyces]|uniref:ParH-like protein n=1 Tax=unclassified Streptomyces TaxID=2593676 RepID=UPI0015E16B76|nr:MULTISPECIES: ParH-like protein [unclassified Streptomyces]